MCYSGRDRPKPGRRGECADRATRNGDRRPYIPGRAAPPPDMFPPRSRACDIKPLEAGSGLFELAGSSGQIGSELVCAAGALWNSESSCGNLCGAGVLYTRLSWPRKQHRFTRRRTGEVVQRIRSCENHFSQRRGSQTDGSSSPRSHYRTACAKIDRF